MSGNARIAVVSRKGNWRPERQSWEEFTVHEKPIDSKEIFIQMLVLATQDNGQKIFYETRGQKATEDTYITKSGKTVSMK